MRRRRHAWLGRIGAAVLFLALLWLAGLVWFVQALPDKPTDEMTRTDAIVVLTGGTERLAVGLDLLDRHLADTLFISGVYTGVDVATILALDDRAPGTLGCCIELGHSAQHTIGNAEETAAWMAEGGRTSLRLVTAAYHMPRSLSVFHRLMPDILIVPHPVFPESVDLQSWWRDWDVFTLLAGEYSKYLVSQVWPDS
jgi:uncharacterized SAM-binding protein YcdF (DUF218 family)